MKGLVQAPSFLRSEGPKKIAVALSGGVDSSVVAHLMQQLLQHHNTPYHHELVAVHMSNWNTQDEDDPYCTQDRDRKDAQAVANQLKLPLHSTSFAAEYWTQVFEPFVQHVEEGRRPNPDVHCNQYIKFGALQDFCQKRLQADVLVTGHYARLWHRHSRNKDSSSNLGGNPYDDLIEEMLQEEHDSNNDNTQDNNAWIRSWGHRNSAAPLTPLLLAAKDRSKCQSLFLSAVPGTAFYNVMFPLGDWIKKKKHNTNSSFKEDDSVEEFTVRDIAIAANLPTAHKKDSMGICFIGKRPGGFHQFIDQYFSEPDDPSTLLGKSPRVDTQHYTFINIDTGEPVPNDTGGISTTPHNIYAPGQGAKISGAKEPWFVVQTDPSTKSILVAQGTHHPALYTDQFTIGGSDCHWMAGDLPTPLQQLAPHTTTTTNATSTVARKQDPVLHAKCRIRNLQPLVDCTITYDTEERRYTVTTKQPLRAVTPGQHCAIYVGIDGLVCLGGGTILEQCQPTYRCDNRQDHVLDVAQLHPSALNDMSVPLQKQ